MIDMGYVCWWMREHSLIAGAGVWVELVNVVVGGVVMGWCVAVWLLPEMKAEASLIHALLAGGGGCVECGNELSEV